MFKFNPKTGKFEDDGDWSQGRSNDYKNVNNDASGNRVYRPQNINFNDEYDVGDDETDEQKFNKNNKYHSTWEFGKGFYLKPYSADELKDMYRIYAHNENALEADKAQMQKSGIIKTEAEQAKEQKQNNLKNNLSSFADKFKAFAQNTFSQNDENKDTANLPDWEEKGRQFILDLPNNAIKGAKSALGNVSKPLKSTNISSNTNGTLADNPGPKDIWNPKKGIDEMLQESDQNFVKNNPTLAKALATAGYVITTPFRALDKVPFARRTKEVTQNVLTAGAANAKEENIGPVGNFVSSFIGTAAGMNMNPLGVGSIGNAMSNVGQPVENTVSRILPTGMNNAAKSIISGAARGGAEWGAYAGASDIANSKDAKTVLKDTALNTIMGSIWGGATRAIGEGVKAAVNKYAESPQQGVHITVENSDGKQTIKTFNFRNPNYSTKGFEEVQQGIWMKQTGDGKYEFILKHVSPAEVNANVGGEYAPNGNVPILPNVALNSGENPVSNTNLIIPPVKLEAKPDYNVLPTEQNKIALQAGAGESKPSAAFNRAIPMPGEVKNSSKAIAMPGKVENITTSENIPYAEAKQSIKPVKVSDINVDPERFQFKLDTDKKTGASKNLDIAKWDPNLAGVVTLWQDNNGKLWVVNGHHRLQKAKELGVKTLDARIIKESDGISDKEAREIGAKINIAEGHGSLTDAAKVFRDGGYNLQEIKDSGLPLSEGSAKKGYALSQLNDNLWDKVISKKITENKAAIIGEALPTDKGGQNDAKQNAIWKDIEGKDVTENVLKEMVDAIKETDSQGFEQQTLWGNEISFGDDFRVKPKLIADIKANLTSDRGAFSKVIKKQDILAKAGNTLNAEENAKEKALIERALEFIDKGKNKKGDPVNDILNKYTELVQRAGMKPSDASKQAEEEITKLIENGDYLNDNKAKEEVAAEGQFSLFGNGGKSSGQNKQNQVGTENTGRNEGLRERESGREEKPEKADTTTGKVKPIIPPVKTEEKKATVIPPVEGAKPKVSEPETVKNNVPVEFTFSKDDIDYKRAYNAYRGISFDPERRAESDQNSYVKDMQDIKDKIDKIAITDEQKKIAIEELSRYKEKYIQKFNAVLDARSRTLSPMITGPARFPVARNQKALDTEQRRINEFMKWQEKAEKALLNKIEGPDTTSKFDKLKPVLDEGIKTIKTIQDHNLPYDISAFRNSISSKLKRIADNGDLETFNTALGYIKQRQKELSVRVFADNNSIWTYGEQAKSRITTKEELQAKGDNTVKEYDGAKIINNYDADRTQLLFDDKPGEEIRNELKSAGWHYSPKNSVWQRKLTANAEASGKRILDKYYKPTKTELENPSMVKEKQEGYKPNYSELKPFAEPQQEISSSATSINASKLPALFNKVKFAQGTTNIDIGGGRFDNVTERLKSQGVNNLIWDPFNRASGHNSPIAASIINGGKADTSTVSNVLNVIREPASRAQTIFNAAYSIKPSGTSYFTIYEGNGTGKGAVSSKGWQENRKTADYLDEVRNFFNDVSVKNGVIIAKHPKGHLFAQLLKETNPEYAKPKNKEALRLAEEAVQQTWNIETGNTPVFSQRQGMDRPATDTRGIINKGIGISTQFIHKGEVNLRGQVVTSPRDVAALAQVFRDPRYETFRLIYTKGDTIVGSEGRTSRIPNMAHAFIKDADTDFKDIRYKMVSIGADGYYMLHNHPSGDPTPSSADKALTRRFADNVPGLKGHVVIDHTKYAVITCDEYFGLVDSDMGDLGYTGEDKLLKPSLPNEWLNAKILNPTQLAGIAKNVQTNNSQAVILYVNAKMNVRAIQEVPRSMFSDKDSALKYLKNMYRNFGAYSSFIVDSTQDNISDIYKTYEEFLKNNYVSDVCYVNDIVSPSVLERENITRNVIDETKEWMGEPVTAEMVKEAAEPYNFQTGKAVWQHGDYSQPVNVVKYLGKYNGRDYVQVEGTNTGVPMDEITYEPVKGKVYENPFKGMNDINNNPIFPKIKPNTEIINMLDTMYKFDKGDLSKADLSQMNFFSDNDAGSIIRVNDWLKGAIKAAKDKKWGLSYYITDVYRNFEDVFGKKNFESARKLYLDPFDRDKLGRVQMEEKLADELYDNIVKKYHMNMGSKKSELVQKYGEGIINLAQLKKIRPNDYQDIVDADKFFREHYDKLLDAVNTVRGQIYPTNPDKIIPHRKDYYRHFKEMAEGFKGLMNLFETPAGINPSLVGVSEYTHPKSKWLSFAQHRLGGKTEYDAVGGYLDYIKAASYATYIDPHITHFQTLADYIAQNTQDTRNLNGFIGWLRDFSGDLAGKTNFLDRPIQKLSNRTALNILRWVNTRITNNVLLGNVSSAFHQLGNLPQGIAKIKNPVYIAKGVGETLKYLTPKVKSNPAMEESQFLKERLTDSYSRFDVKFLDQPKKFLRWVMEQGDNIGTVFTWNGLYYKAKAKGISNPVRYADYETRKLVAGRGVGEVPLLYKSMRFKLIAPFQLEVGNLWQVYKDFGKEKDFAGIVMLMLASYMFNNIMEKVDNNRIVFDPIKALVDASKEKDTNVLQKAGRLGGEALSNMPLGQTIASMMPESIRTKYFGKNDPARYGNSILIATGVKDPLYKILPPYGGNQAEKAVKGYQAVKKGGVFDSQGRLKYPVTGEDMLKALLFGPGAAKEAKQYYDRDLGPLTKTQMEKYNKGLKMGKDSVEMYSSFMDDQEAEAEKNRLYKMIGDMPKSKKSSIQTRANSIVNSKLSLSEKLKRIQDLEQLYGR